MRSPETRTACVGADAVDRVVPLLARGGAVIARIALHDGNAALDE